MERVSLKLNFHASIFFAIALCRVGMLCFTLSSLDKGMYSKRKNGNWFHVIKSIFNLIPIHYFKTVKGFYLKLLYLIWKRMLCEKRNWNEIDYKTLSGERACNGMKGTQKALSQSLHYHDSLPLLKLSKFSICSQLISFHSPLLQMKSFRAST